MGVIQRQGIKSAIITYSGILIGFVSLLVVQPNLLKPEEIGLTRILYSFSFLVSTLIPLSIGNITTRFFPRFRDKEGRNHGYFGFMLLWLGIGSLIVLPVLWIFHNYFISVYSEKSGLFANYFFLVFPLTITIALISTISNYLYSAFKPIIPAFAQEILIRVLFIGLIVIYAAGWLSLNQFVIGFIATYIMQFLVLLFYTLNSGGVSFRIDRQVFSNSVIREMLHYGWMVFLAGIASMAIKLLDTVVLGQFVSLSLVGVYGIAAFIPTFIEAPLTALDKIANARVAYSWEKNELQNIRDIYYKSAHYLFLLGGLLFLLVTINAPHLFRLLPPQFKAGIPVVSILSLGALFNLMTGSNTAIIFTSNRFATGTIALVGVTFVNLLLLYMLIPKLGLEGAAWATCSASFLFNGFKYMYIKLRFGLQPFDKRTLLISFAIVIAYGAGNSLPVFGNVFIDLIVCSSVTVLVYSLLIWYSRAADDLKELIPFFRSSKTPD
jgi:O-antigen/teichoic acid export membrane protein